MLELMQGIIDVQTYNNPIQLNETKQDVLNEVIKTDVKEPLNEIVKNETKQDVLNEVIKTDVKPKGKK